MRRPVYEPGPQLTAIADSSEIGVLALLATFEMAVVNSFACSPVSLIIVSEITFPLSSHIAAEQVRPEVSMQRILAMILIYLVVGTQLNECPVCGKWNVLTIGNYIGLPVELLTLS